MAGPNRGPEAASVLLAAALVLAGCAGRGKQTLEPYTAPAGVASAPASARSSAREPASSEPSPAPREPGRVSPTKPSAESVTPVEPAQEYDLAPVPVRVRDPEYPAAARERGVHGTVVVEFVIDTSGRVSRARVVRSVPGLDKAALDCVRSWRFKPALRGGKPVATTARAPVRF